MKFIVVLICSILVFTTKAQKEMENKSTTIDTTHSVKKAVIFSAVIPGAGQIYNHRAMPPKKRKAFWKVPLIYAGLGATGYFLLQNNSLQRSLKMEYNLREKSDFSQTFDSQWEQYDSQGVLNLYNQRLNQRDLFILAFGAVYILQVVDAAVEAHFVQFDVSEDLSLNLHPTMLGLASPGLRLTLNFR